MENSREPKVGDVVHVKLQIVEVSAYGWIGAKDSDGDTLGISRADIVHIEPAPLKVGDRVFTAFDVSIIGKVLCIEGDCAWVKWPSYLDTHHISDLTRISDGAAS